MTQYTASTLRQNIYRILDRILETGKPVTVERGGKTLTIAPPQKPSKLAALKKRKGLKADPESLVSLNWEGTWQPKL